MLDELCETIDYARDLFSITDVGTETNPNHIVQPWLDKLHGRVQRLSVGVQSFNNDLLKQMDRYDKYGDGETIFENIGIASEYFDSLNVDMIFNFPSQTEEILIDDLEKIATCGCRQTTFSPLYVSNATMRKMRETLGPMDWNREYRFYQLIDGVLAGGKDPMFRRTTLWDVHAQRRRHRGQRRRDRRVPGVERIVPRRGQRVDFVP
jgi:coproporphyrinogen III oxidase-like Fe-S oxidoreductase